MHTIKLCVSPENQTRWLKVLLKKSLIIVNDLLVSHGNMSRPGLLFYFGHAKFLNEKIFYKLKKAKNLCEFFSVFDGELTFDIYNNLIGLDLFREHKSAEDFFSTSEKFFEELMRGLAPYTIVGTRILIENDGWNGDSIFECRFIPNNPPSQKFFQVEQLYKPEKINISNPSFRLRYPLSINQFNFGYEGHDIPAIFDKLNPLPGSIYEFVYEMIDNPSLSFSIQGDDTVFKVCVHYSLANSQINTYMVHDRLLVITWEELSHRITGGVEVGVINREICVKTHFKWFEYNTLSMVWQECQDQSESVILGLQTLESLTELGP